jgi:hypothetical protein
MSGKKRPLNGNRSSPGVVHSSGNGDKANLTQLRRMLAAIYDRYQRLDDPAANKQCRQDFVFHLTDWLGDLQRLTELYQHPERFDREAGGDIVAGFLYHAIPHFMEAGRLMLDYQPGYIFDSPKSATSSQRPLKPARRRGPRAPSP